MPIPVSPRHAAMKRPTPLQQRPPSPRSPAPSHNKSEIFCSLLVGVVGGTAMGESFGTTGTVLGGLFGVMVNAYASGLITFRRGR